MLNNPCLLELMLSCKVFLSHILELVFELSGSHKGFSYTLVNSCYPFFFPFPSAPFPLNPLVTSSSLFFLVTCILLSLRLYLIGLYGVVGFHIALHITRLWLSLPSILWLSPYFHTLSASAFLLQEFHVSTCFTCNLLFAFNTSISQRPLLLDSL